ncbi:MAG: hypothetical protein QOF51_478 [Chloroflexota bacterium]|jgi:hypothetical protein|nr:hypothetical protein [Chloroflexota bacterium]
MSEYQYYEFRAIDRPLTAAQMAEIRAITTRAKITPTRFVNEYQWGDFKGDPSEMMKRYYDAFLYIANWGTHWFMLRLPRALLAADLVYEYSGDDGLAVSESGDHIILEFTSGDEEPEYDDEEGGDWLPSLLPLREELAAGDLRALYLGWLYRVQVGFVDDDDGEPPVPPGLGALSPALVTLAEFLRLDEDLIAVAAEASIDVGESRPSAGDVEQWITTLPVEEKDQLLVRVARGETLHLQAELTRRAREGSQLAASPADDSAQRRTVAELLESTEQRTAVRQREEAERRAQEQARRQREEAAQRTSYLEGLVGHEDAIWQQVESLVQSKQPNAYDEAVRLLVDLRELGERTGTLSRFHDQLDELRARHGKKVSFIERFDRVGLRRQLFPSG